MGHPVGKQKIDLSMCVGDDKFPAIYVIWGRMYKKQKKKEKMKIWFLWLLWSGALTHMLKLIK